MSFAKQAADELLPDPETEAPLDPEAVKAKKDHWKKWLAALGILGGVGAGAYIYNRPGANGQSLGRNFIQSLGIANKPDLGPDPSGVRGMAGAGAGFLAPELLKVPAVKSVLSPHTTLRGLAASAKEVARPVDDGNESAGNTELRQLNQAMGGGNEKGPNEQLRNLLEAHANQKPNPLTDAAKLRAAVDRKTLKVPATENMSLRDPAALRAGAIAAEKPARPPESIKANTGLLDKVLGWNKSRQDADKLVSDLEWVGNNPGAAKGGLSAKGIQESLPRGIEPGRMARDLAAARGAPLLKNTWGKKGLLGRLALGAGGSLLGHNYLMPSPTDL